MTTGIGGIFFKSRDPQNLKSWYAKHLGISDVFPVIDIKDKRNVSTIWSPLAESDEIFGKKEFAISYRVENLEALAADLKTGGAHSGHVDERPEGKFLHVFDPEANKVILWEPASGQPRHQPLARERVTGLGGVFFKAEDVANLKQWYTKNLGLNVTEWGCSFEWIDPANPDAKDPATTAWSPFASSSNYFEPSKKQFMFNYRVGDLRALLKGLEASGIQGVGEVQEFSYGKFGWLVDPEGNKMELWEPVDGGF
jgi:predicted enzyme related to lactoylglutathione lyase